MIAYRTGISDERLEIQCPLRGRDRGWFFLTSSMVFPKQRDARFCTAHRGDWMQKPTTTTIMITTTKRRGGNVLPEQLPPPLQGLSLRRQVTGGCAPLKPRRLPPATLSAPLRGAVCGCATDAVESEPVMNVPQPVVVVQRRALKQDDRAQPPCPRPRLCTNCPGLVSRDSSTGAAPASRDCPCYSLGAPPGLSLRIRDRCSRMRRERFYACLPGHETIELRYLIR